MIFNNIDAIKELRYGRIAMNLEFINKNEAFIDSEIQPSIDALKREIGYIKKEFSTEVKKTGWVFKGTDYKTELESLVAEPLLYATKIKSMTDKKEAKKILDEIRKLMMKSGDKKVEYEAKLLEFETELTKPKDITSYGLSYSFDEEGAISLTNDIMKMINLKITKFSELENIKDRIKSSSSQNLKDKLSLILKDEKAVKGSTLSDMSAVIDPIIKEFEVYKISLEEEKKKRSKMTKEERDEEDKKIIDANKKVDKNVEKEINDLKATANVSQLIGDTISKGQKKQTDLETKKKQIETDRNTKLASISGTKLENIVDIEKKILDDSIKTNEDAILLLGDTTSSEEKKKLKDEYTNKLLDLKEKKKTVEADIKKNIVKEYDLELEKVNEKLEKNSTLIKKASKLETTAKTEFKAKVELLREETLKKGKTSAELEAEAKALKDPPFYMKLFKNKTAMAIILVITVIGLIFAVVLAGFFFIIACILNSAYQKAYIRAALLQGKVVQFSYFQMFSRGILGFVYIFYYVLKFGLTWRPKV